MVKKLVGVSLVALLAFTTQGRAQLAVTDPGDTWVNTEGVAVQNQTLLQTLQGYKTQLQQYATQLQSLEQQVQQVTWLATTAESLIQNPNLGAVMALAGQLGLNQDLPVSPYAVMGLVNGFNGLSTGGGIGQLTGAFGSLNGLVNNSFTVNSAYTCTATTFPCTQQQQMANSAAGTQGIMQTLYQDLANHVQILQSLQTSASASTTPAQRENVLNEIALQQAWVNNSGNQIQAVSGMWSAQQQVNQNRANEVQSQNTDTWIASIPAGG